MGLDELCLHSPKGQDGAATLVLSALKPEGELKPEQDLPAGFCDPDGLQGGFGMSTHKHLFKGILMMLSFRRTQAEHPQSLWGPLGWLESGYEDRRCTIATKLKKKNQNVHYLQSHNDKYCLGPPDHFCSFLWTLLCHLWCCVSSPVVKLRPGTSF